jgi:hypothetical protein
MILNDDVQGVVLRVDDEAPMVVIRTAGGTEYRITGLGAVGCRELRDADLRPGDLLAYRKVKRTIKSGRLAGKTYWRHSIAVRRAYAAM